ncbi:hypothetical protein VTK26DRAFT_6796 [Humicola hyalothermophila]
MGPPMPSATATWHNDTYAAISPLRPELSARDKTVVIIGAGSGIGRQTALSFANAGAARIVLIGRTESTLKETAALLPTSASSVVQVVDITDEAALKSAAASIGTWDVLVLSAVYASAVSTIAATDVDEWWKGFETNVKGTFLAVKTFIPTAAKPNAAVLAVTSGTVAFPPAMAQGMSSYNASKLAQVKLVEYLAFEQPDIHAVAVHPGIHDTAVLAKSGAKPDQVPLDNIKLAGDFLVWLASPEAAFLKGRTVWANWDVDELKAQAETIQAGVTHTSGLNGWPYPNM